MKKYVIGGTVLLIALFAVQERCAKTSKFAAGGPAMDQRAASRAADAVEQSLAEAGRCFAAKNYGGCAAQLRRARSHFAPFQQLFGSVSFRDGKTMNAWTEEKIEGAGNALASQLDTADASVDQVLDLSGLREVAQAAGKSRFAAAFGQFERKLVGALQDRTVVTLRTSGVEPELRGDLIAVLAERVRPDPKLTFLVGASPLLEALPNIAGGASLQLNLTRPRYFAANPLPSGSLLQGIGALADEATLTIKPDEALAASSSWKQAMEFQYSDLLAPKLEFAGRSGKFEEGGRPALRRVTADTDQYPGKVDEFIPAWNAYFWKQLRKKLTGLPVLTAERPNHNVRLLDAHELTGRISVDVTLQSADQHRLVLAIQRSEQLVRSMDLATGKYLTHIDTRHASRLAPVALGDALVLLNDKTQAIERWSLRTGAKLSSANPAVPGDVQAVFVAQGCDRFVLCISRTPQTDRSHLAVLDPVTGQVDGAIVDEPEFEGGEARWTFKALRADFGQRLTADAAFRAITVDDGDSQAQIQRHAGGLKLIARRPSTNAAASAVPPGALCTVAGLDGPGALLVARDGLLYLPSGPAGQSGPWPLMHLGARRSTAGLIARDSSRALQLTHPLLYFPTARRCCFTSASGQALLFYAY